MRLLSKSNAGTAVALALAGKAIFGSADLSAESINYRPDNLSGNLVTQVTANINSETQIFQGVHLPEITFEPANQKPAVAEVLPVKSENQMMSSARKGMLNFFNDNFASIIALGAIAIMAFNRIFPNEWDIESLGLCEIDDQSRKKTVYTATVANKSLSEVYGWDFPAFLQFHYSMAKTRRNTHLPIVIFKDFFLNRLFSDPPVMELLKKARSHMSGTLLGQNHSENLNAHAETRFRNKPPKASEYLMVFTYECHGVVKPRSFLISPYDAVNILADLDQWWKASDQNSPGCRRRLVRNIEMAVSFLLRYPKVFEEKFGGEGKLQTAQKTARNLFRMLALSPEDSEKFINDYLAAELPRESLIKPSQEEKNKIFRTWYATKDQHKWHKFAALEKQLTSFHNYLDFCWQNRIPPWFVNIIKTNEVEPAAPAEGRL